MNEQECERHIEGWLRPMDGLDAAGLDPREIPAYEALRDEIAKLESPTLGACRWEKVELEAARVLEKSKDLASASYLSCALAQRHGIHGLLLGTMLLGRLLRDHVEFYPLRPRARANALVFFLDRAEQQALTAQPRPEDRESLTRLAGAIASLRTVISERLGAEGPSVHRFSEATERLVLSLPPEHPPSSSSKEAAPAQEPRVVTTSSATPKISDEATHHATSPENPSNAGKIPQFLAQVGVGLCTTSRLMTQSNPHDLEGIRLFLTGLYLPVTQLPSLVREKRMGLKGPPENIRNEVERGRRETDPNRLLELAMRGLEKHRFWFDLHLAMHEALIQLGPTAEHAQTLHEHELRTLIARLPGLFELEFLDGKPCASSETRVWLESLSRTPSTAPLAVSNEETDTFEHARALLRGGKIKDALSFVQGTVNQATDARARFAARLVLATIAVEGKVKGLGIALSGELIREAMARNLAEWDPSLVARTCDLYLRAALDEPLHEARLPFSRAEIHARLCLLDPVAAVAFGAH